MTNQVSTLRNGISVLRLLNKGQFLSVFDISPFGNDGLDYVAAYTRKFFDVEGAFEEC